MGSEQTPVLPPLPNPLIKLLAIRLSWQNTPAKSLVMRGNDELAADRLIPYPLRLRALFAQALPLVRFIFLIVAVEERPLGIAFRREDVGRDAVEEPAVVGDDHHAAGEFEQRIFQRAQGFHVQVVGGFIEQQHVAAGDKGLRQVQASAFTTGKLAFACAIKSVSRDTTIPVLFEAT